MMQKVYVAGAFFVEQLNVMSGPHPGCVDGCKLVEYGTGKEHEHEMRCADDCVAHRLYDWWYGNFDADGRFFGVVIPRARDWDCRRRLALAGFHVFPSQHSPHALSTTESGDIGEHVRLVAHLNDAQGQQISYASTMRDVALALHAHYGHPALHPDS